MAQKYDRRRYGYTDGSLAYDLDALARERALEEAGRVEEDRREPAAAPRRQPVARPVAKLSPLVLVCAALLAGLVVVLLMGYVRLTEVTADITQLKREMSQQEERHVALLTQYEKTFDLATVKRVAEEEGMKSPSAVRWSIWSCRPATAPWCTAATQARRWRASRRPSPTQPKPWWNISADPPHIVGIQKRSKKGTSCSFLWYNSHVL